MENKNPDKFINKRSVDSPLPLAHHAKELMQSLLEGETTRVNTSPCESRRHGHVIRETIQSNVITEADMS